MDAQGGGGTHSHGRRDECDDPVVVLGGNGPGAVSRQGRHPGAHQQYGLADQPDREPWPSAFREPLQDDARDGCPGDERADRGGGPRHRNVASPASATLPLVRKLTAFTAPARTVSTVMTATRRAASVARTGDASDMRPV
jgi:hypothetical protein